jgi:hypothetical protein
MVEVSSKISRGRTRQGNGRYWLHVGAPTIPRAQDYLFAVLYAGMICVGIYAFYLWLGAEAPDTRSERKGFWLMASAGIAVGALGLYLMWTDILAPLFRKRT